MKDYFKLITMYSIGSIIKVQFTNEIKAVTIRSVVSKRMLKVSLGFDSKGNDINCLILTSNII